MEYKITKERSHLFTPTPNTFLIATLIGMPSFDEIKLAIAKTVQKHELLRAALSLHENGDAYYVAGEASGCTITEIPELKDFNALIRSESLRCFDCEHGELIRFFICRGEDRVQLAICAHHMVGDDESLLCIVRDIAGFIDNPGIKCESMPIVQLEESSAAAQQKLPFSISFMMKLTNFQWKRQAKVFSFADHDAIVSTYAEKNPTAVCSQLLSAEQTSQLLSWCETMEVSLCSAVVSAFLCISEENSFTVQCSLRPDGTKGLGTFVTSVSVDYYPLPESDFVTKTQELHARVADKTVNPQKAQFQLGFLKSLDQTLVDSAYFAAFDNYVNPISQRAMMMFGLKSSPKALCIHDLTGQADTGVQALALIPTLTPNVRRALALTMVNGQLCITMQYPARESAEMQRTFTDALMMLLRQGRTL